MIATLFLKHPRSVDENYFEHLIFAARFGFWLALAAGAALIHAILPFLFEKTAGRIVARLNERLINRN